MRRVYREVAAAAAGDAFEVRLDGRSLRTPAQAPMALPTMALARAIAEEWDAQAEVVRPPTMPLTRLAATAIDRVARLRRQAVEEVVEFGGTDLLCYRAERPEELIALEHAAWQPVLDWLRRRFDVHLEVTHGVMGLRQQPATLAALRTVVAAQDDFRLVALHALTTVMGSLALALAVLEGEMEAEAAFAASRVDEDFQSRQWGLDSEAAERREALRLDVAAAARFLALLRERPA